jgi:hypothetical protein
MLLLIIFATVFPTINHLYSTLASPIISEGYVAAAESLNLRVVSVYIPDGQRCDRAAHWYARRCYTAIGDTTWEDFCRPNPDDEHNFYMRIGECPGGRMCQNTLVQNEDDPAPKETISCIDRPYSPNLLSPNRQTGVYMAENVHSLDPAQRTVSAIVEINLAGATVAALMEGMYSIPD